MADSASLGKVFTVGHSNTPIEDLVRLLRLHRIATLVDVRSAPYSRYAGQFNREVFEERLPREGVRYVFMGAELGGRPHGAPEDWAGGPDYDEMAKRPEFAAGLERLIDLARREAVCILCSEEDPAHCHRALLVGRELDARGVPVVHIRGDGSTETQGQVHRRITGGQLTLFRTRTSVTVHAVGYFVQARSRALPAEGGVGQGL